MSLTISELEAERAKILEEIENKAQKFSGDSQKPEQASLKSWLNAAEEVMPATKSEKTMKTKAKSNYQSQVFKPPRNKVPFFGVLIILTLLLTLLGVLYIAYSSLHKELQNVLQAHEKSTVQMKALQEEMTVLQKSIATGGKVELFIALEDKIFSLEAQILALKKQVETPVIASVNNIETPSSSNIAVAPITNSAKPGDKLVTESVLDKSLKRYTESLEKRIDQKLEVILSYLTENQLVEGRNIFSADQEEVNTPGIPKEPTVKVPVIQQPLVQLVKPIQKPSTPKLAETSVPIKHYSADVKWLMSEPKMHYTLQLASMPEAHSLQQIINKHQLKEGRILPQTRKGITNYVLITGSFSDRALANELAKKIKTESGISPWVRKIKDLTSRIQ